MNNFYFNLRLQKPSNIQCNIDTYRANLWNCGILAETSPITDGELKRYYREDIKDKNLYYEVEECNYNEEKAFKSGLIPFISKSKLHTSYHIAIHTFPVTGIGNFPKLDAYYFLITGNMDKRSNYFIDSEKNKFCLAVGNEIFNAIEAKFGGVKLIINPIRDISELTENELVDLEYLETYKFVAFKDDKVRDKVFKISEHFHNNPFSQNIKIGEIDNDGKIIFTKPVEKLNVFTNITTHKKSEM